ncbi:MAG: ketoacyl-ACP synthase III [Opitutales bacterium]|nr:ketoacyl-ACP synthase III [Opitutales bacterium]
MDRAIIRGIGSYVPDRVLTNADLESMVETTHEWIVTRTGIESRHICLDTENTSDLCLEAAKHAVANAGIAVCDLDMIVTATITPDFQFPSTACLIQEKLGCNDIPCFDLGAACSGFIYALDVARNSIASNASIKNVLVIGGEKLSSVVDWEDRSTCVLFGDGAGAAVISRAPGVGETGILDVLIGADGRCAKLLYCPGSDVSSGTERHLKMEGREVFKEAVRRMCAAVEDILLRNHLSIEDIACVVPHQANTRIITAIAERVKIPEEKLFVNLAHTGNTSAASIPIALDEAVREGKIQSGNLVLLVAFGAGMTWGSALVRWT